MSEQTSRRDFLIRSLAAGGVTAGLPKGAWAWAEPPSASAPGEKLIDMAIVRWGAKHASGEATGEAQGEVAGEASASRLTQSAIDALGGMKRFVKKGDVVWIKPNIGWNRAPKYAANTHPDVVAMLVELCLGAGAKTVKVGDYTCNEARLAYEKSGIGPAAKKKGAEIVYLDKDRFRDMKIGGNRLRDHPVYPEIVECDLVINVPVAKHHGATKVTLCMKNYMGVVEKRRTFHQDLPTTIADITQFMKPRLSVLDATRILTRHGPGGGNLKDVKVLNTIAAGTDIVALDAFGSELLGHKPADIGTVAMGEKYKLGRMDYRSLALKELQIS